VGAAAVVVGAGGVVVGAGGVVVGGGGIVTGRVTEGATDGVAECVGAADDVRAAADVRAAEDLAAAGDVPAAEGAPAGTGAAPAAGVAPAAGFACVATTLGSLLEEPARDGAEVDGVDVLPVGVLVPSRVTTPTAISATKKPPITIAATADSPKGPSRILTRMSISSLQRWDARDRRTDYPQLGRKITERRNTPRSLTDRNHARELRPRLGISVLHPSGNSVTIRTKRRRSPAAGGRPPGPAVSG
jgi:hypothetical protein